MIKYSITNAMKFAQLEKQLTSSVLTSHLAAVEVYSRLCQCSVASLLGVVTGATDHISQS